MNLSIGMVLLCCYLFLVGILAVTNITVAFAGVVLGILAILAAIFLALGK